MHPIEYASITRIFSFYPLYKEQRAVFYSIWQSQQLFMNNRVQLTSCKHCCEHQSANVKRWTIGCLAMEPETDVFNWPGKTEESLINIPGDHQSSLEWVDCDADLLVGFLPVNAHNSMLPRHHTVYLVPPMVWFVCLRSTPLPMPGFVSQAHRSNAQSDPFIVTFVSVC